MFGNAISEVTFYDPGTPQSLSAPPDSQSQHWDFPQCQNSGCPFSNRSFPSSLLPTSAAAAAEGSSCPPGLSQRDFSLVPVEGKACSTNLRGQNNFMLSLRNRSSKAWKMQRAQTETYFPCGYAAAWLPAHRQAICASLGKTQ